MNVTTTLDGPCRASSPAIVGVVWARDLRRLLPLTVKGIQRQKLQSRAVSTMPRFVFVLAERCLVKEVVVGVEVVIAVDTILVRDSPDP